MLSKGLIGAMTSCLGLATLVNAGNWAASCDHKNARLVNAFGWALEATCGDGNGGWKTTILNLNYCFAFDGDRFVGYPK